MTQLQPNDFAAGLRRALDLATERRDRYVALSRINGVAYEAELYVLNGMIDTLSDQLLDAGGFLGDEPEPEDLTAFVIDRHGELLGAFDLMGDDELNPDIYAKLHADTMGCTLDTSGLIPDGCEDFSIKIAAEADSVVCWTSRNYAIKGE